VLAPLNIQMACQLLRYVGNRLLNVRIDALTLVKGSRGRTIAAQQCPAFAPISCEGGGQIICRRERTFSMGVRVALLRNAKH
jgi:hypothetical protein